jgi:transposase
MGRFVEGEDRRQPLLLPESLDDYVTEDNPVRVVEVFIDELDLSALGFDGMEPATTGRPAYHPSTMLKIYLYGYLNRIASSRRLEREAQRNIELMWLTGRLAPDFKTIANFRVDNGPAIQKACAQFVLLCRQLGLFTRAVVAIDGSKFKAVNNRDKNYTVAKVAKRLEQRVHNAPDQQVSLTDPDARSMATSGRGTGMVGYNVQTAVDAEHHLIVAHEVTNQGHDRSQLEPMGLKAKDAIGCEEVTALADRGYFSGDQVLACEGTGVIPIVPKTETSSGTKRGFFTRADFVYDAAQDRYTCPAGAKLTKATRRADHAEDFDFYRHLGACFTCPLKPKCTPTKLRRLKRWEHEGVLDKMQARLDRMPNAMAIRRQTVEHPYATLKAWMGATHFLTKTLKKVKTEMSLQVLAYNIKQMIQILGVGPLIAAIRA